jgi:predicted helicase
VVVGNPPYNVGQLNENDNNKNRKYDTLDKSIKATYAKDSAASSVSKLNDPYVKFFRWATYRLNGRDGVVCFVSNNSFVDQIAFDGMRKHLLRDFTRVYHLHLEGNVRQNPTLSGTQYNVFGIQVGVGITVAVRSSKHKDHRLLFHRIGKNLRRYEKLGWLTEYGSLSRVTWRALSPDRNGTWLVPKNTRTFAGLMAVADKEGRIADVGQAEVIFKDYNLGVATHRDRVVYGFDVGELGARVEQFVEAYNAEVDRFHRHGRKADPETFAWGSRVVWDSDLKQFAARKLYAAYDAGKIRRALYRPFATQYLYFDRLLNARIYSQEKHYPNTASEAENRTVCVTSVGSEKPFMTLATSGIADLHLVGTGSGTQCFPFYVYDADGANRRENVTDWALKQFRTHYKDKKLTKWDIFHYVYGLLHHPGYRAKYADNLKKSLPRIPFAPDFRAFAEAGEQLAELHLNYEQIKPFDLKFVETPGVPLSYRVEAMKLSKDKTSLRVNDSLMLAGLPPAAFEYRLGNRSALEWVIDQYGVTEDKRSGIKSDPNRTDDPEYIVNLVGRVVRVSVETVRIVNGLPNDFGG